MIRIKLNPVLENEMKRNMRSIKGSWVIFIVNVILTVVALLTYFGTVGQQDFLTSGQYRFPVQYYVMMAYALFLMICILVPGIAGGSIAIERDRRTLDLLLTTHLSPWKVVIGKLESSLSFIFLVAFSALPVMALILVFGGVSFVDLFALVGILVISGIFIGSMVILLCRGPKNYGGNNRLLCDRSAAHIGDSYSFDWISLHFKCEGRADGKF